MAANINNMGYNYPMVASNDFANGASNSGGGISGVFGEGTHLRTTDNVFKNSGSFTT